MSEALKLLTLHYFSPISDKQFKPKRTRSSVINMSLTFKPSKQETLIKC